MLLALVPLPLSKPRIMSLTRKAVVEKASREGQGGEKVKGHTASSDTSFYHAILKN